MKRIICLILTAFLLFGCSFGCAGNKEQRELTEKELQKIADKIPDYSSKTHQFELFAYSAASNGYFTDSSGEYYVGESLCNVEKFTLYKDCGFTFMHPQSCIEIQATDNFTYKGSRVESFLDTAEEAGTGRVIIPDYRFNALLQQTDIGLEAYASGDQAKIAAFKDTYGIFVDQTLSLERLDAKVKEFMGEYAQHPAFYGVILWDEVSAKLFEGYAEVYKAIKRCFPDAYCLCNLFPPAGLVGTFSDEFLSPYTVTDEEIAEFQHVGDGKRFAMFKKYISIFLDMTGIDYLMYDQYPMLNESIHNTYILGLQIAAEACKERGISFGFVTQSYGVSGGHRLISDEDATWLNNMLLGFGVDTIGYYTYYPRGGDGGNFVDAFGDPTSVYYTYQAVNKRIQTFAPTILSFKYKQSQIIRAEGDINFNSSYLTNGISTGAFSNVSKVVVDKETVLVNELYDEENKRSMYMIQNVVDTIFTGSKSWQTTTLEFNEDYEYALVYENGNGEGKVVKLVENKFTTTQHPGQAVFVIPFNA